MGRDAQVKVAITAEDQTATVISNVERELANLGSSISGLGTVLSGVGLGGGALLGVGAGIIAMADSTAKYEAAIGRAAESTKMTVGALSGLRVISEETGTSFDSLTTSLARLGKNVAEGLAKPSSEAGKVLSALFTTADLQSLKLLSVDDRVQVVLQAISHLTDAGEQQIATSTLVGRGWTMVAAALERVGSGGLADAVTTAMEKGVYVTDEAARSALAYEKVMAGMDLSFTGFERAISEGLIQPLYEAAVALQGQAGPVNAYLDRIKTLKTVHGDYKVVLKDTVKALDNFNLAEAKAAGGGYTVQMPKPKSMADALGGAGKGGSRSGTDIALAERMRVAAEKQRELSAGMREYAQLLDSLLPTEGAFDKATKEYATTLDRINQLELKGVDVTLAKADALRRLNEQLAAARDQAMRSGDWAKGYKALGLGTENEPSKQNAPAPMDRFFQMMEYGDLKDSQAQLEKMGALGKKFGDEMSGGFAQMIVYGRGFTDMLRGALDMLIKLVLEALVFKPLADMFGGSGGGFLGGLFSGLSGHAGGGDVAAGVPSIVGEQGPELFVPGTSGTIMPHGSFGGGGITVNYNVDARGADAFADKRLLLAMQMTKAAAVNQAVSQAREAKLRSAG